MKKRWPLLVLVGVGIFLWKTGAFGLLPTDRTVIWRFPVSYGEIRKLELQIWQGDELLKREEQVYAAGLSGEASFKVPLSSGTHRAIATVGLSGASEPRGFQQDFEAGSDETVVIDLSVKKP